MKKGKRGIKQIIFDLGGVIIDLHVQKTVERFSALSRLSTEEIETIYAVANFFEAYEVGKLSDTTFRNEIRESLSIDADDGTIDAAWNAMLGDIPLERLEQVASLKRQYQCIILSNTNAIHEKAFHSILLNQHGYKHLNEIFDLVYFSHELAMRKPNREIFEEIIARSGIGAEHSIFMDDGESNIKAAKEAGIEALFISRNRGFHPQLTALLNQND